jgi:hypothetical protein
MAQPKRKKTPDATPALQEALAPRGWQKPKGLTPRGWAVLVAVVALINLPVIHHFLRSPPEASVSLPFHDTFDSDATIAAHYFTTGGLWRVRDAALLSPGVKNNPLWLKAKLPRNVRVEFDATALSNDGDIRVEIFGNGVDHNSGYELIQGGWRNSIATIVRHEETGPTMGQLEVQARADGHGDDLIAAGYDRHTSVKVERPYQVHQGQTYHWVIERRDKVLRWSIDGQPLLELNDPVPLEGKWNDRFGLSSGDGGESQAPGTEVAYDNLSVTALDDAGFAPGSGPAQTHLDASPRPYADSFERETLGGMWNATDPGAVRIDNGAVLVQNGHNHPVWLTQAIPENAAVELDVWTDSSEGDMKVELWGDGRSYFQGDPRAAYESTGYIFVMGGWHNTTSAIARIHEHGHDRAERSDVHVEPGKRYHWRITRQGGHLEWQLDGQPFLKLDDPQPLTGEGHQYFAFGDWESPVHFDNLRIEPL